MLILLKIAVIILPPGQLSKKVLSKTSKKQSNKCMPSFIPCFTSYCNPLLLCNACLKTVHSLSSVTLFFTHSCQSNTATYLTHAFSVPSGEHSYSSTLTSSVLAHSEHPDPAALSSGIICSKRHKSSETNLVTLMIYEAKDKVMVMSLFESL